MASMMSTGYKATCTTAIAIGCVCVTSPALAGAPTRAPSIRELREADYITVRAYWNRLQEALAAIANHPRAWDPAIGRGYSWAPHLHKAAKRHKIAPLLLFSFVMVESGGNPKARSRKNARGLMQLVESTGVHYGLSRRNSYRDFYDARRSLDAGAHLLHDLWLEHQNLLIMTMSYNFGARNLREKIRRDKFNRPRFPEGAVWYAGTIVAAAMRTLDTMCSLPTFIWPVEGRLTSSFGKRRDPIRRNEFRFHGGIDIAAPRGTPVRAAANGRVLFIQRGHRGYGNVVVVGHGDLLTLYAHLDRITTRVGDLVSSGELIATVGDTGRTTGSHLHYEVRRGRTPVNPMHYLHSEE